jgi:hypothetical protein
MQSDDHMIARFLFSTHRGVRMDTKNDGSDANDETARVR